MYVPYLIYITISSGSTLKRTPPPHLSQKCYILYYSAQLWKIGKMICIDLTAEEHLLKSSKKDQLKT